ncbi:alpha-L-fucosidase [Maribacter vaceletii]|uniref:alpha-L-fucosidase n=1 Tax=Maribacter vaceletii TaxID=1206816 RepID=A0A495EB05_9FLAO|nr:alpha-L-fucosidase [Maribacter vaceletii]RKR14078.1 alpha-L-fucosidase [Maribacter vaceletii]
MKKNIHLLTVLFLLGFNVELSSQEKKENKYKANWSSLRKHKSPDWLYDMKFGIYCHWGPQTVQLASDDKEITRLEAIEQWEGKKFNSKKWVDLFQSAGAQFAGPVAWHGSGLVNWDSNLTDWNSVKKGPKVDIYGSLSKELRERGMPVISSFHTGNFWERMWGTLSQKNSVYINPYEDNSIYATSNEGRISNEIFNAWFDRITEAVNKYEPDIIWFDTGFGGTVKGELLKWTEKGRLLPEGNNELISAPEKYQQKMISHFFNKGIEWGKDVEVIYKTHDIPVGIGMRDVEDGNLIGLQYDSWMADVNMQRHFTWNSNWFYNPVNKVKSAGTLIDMLIDMTSKNGRMLLNVPPMADGSFAPEVKKELYAMGNWLKINKEAIYNTMPWVFFGEGPTEVTNPGHHGQGKEHGELIPKYTAEDIRFTQNGRNLYAICMDWPGKEVLIRTLGSMGKLYPRDIKSISLLGSTAKLSWQQTGVGLVVQFPKEKPCDFAYVLKIERN